MAQLQASPSGAQAEPAEPIDKERILMLNSEEEDNYTEVKEDTMYGMSQQVASPNDFAAAKNSSNGGAKNSYGFTKNSSGYAKNSSGYANNSKSNSIPEDSHVMNEDEEDDDYFLDEENIDIEK